MSVLGLVLMDELSMYLSKVLGLVPSPESKYDSGVALTNLNK